MSILKVRIKTIVLILLSVFTAATFCSCSEEKPPLEASVVRFFENFDKDAYRIGSEDFIYSVKANRMYLSSTYEKRRITKRAYQLCEKHSVGNGFMGVY